MSVRDLNRIGAALACAASAAGGCWVLALVLVPDSAPPHPALAIIEAAVPTSHDVASHDAPPHDSAPVAIADRLAHASVERGATLAATECGSCHTLDRDAPAGVGPNLFGVVDRPVAAAPLFRYSTALAALGGRWNVDRLDTWLAGPQAMAPGTAMGFAGLADPAARADLIAFLRKQAPAPGTGDTAAFETLVAAADPKQGGTLAAARCGGCHTFNQGETAAAGPNLFGVAGRGIAQGPDYRYSAALSARTGHWTVAALGDWLAGPARFAPGTRMEFAGIADPATRAAVVAYLRTLHP